MNLQKDQGIYTWFYKKKSINWGRIYWKKVRFLLGLVCL